MFVESDKRSTLTRVDSEASIFSIGGKMPLILTSLASAAFCPDFSSHLVRASLIVVPPGFTKRLKNDFSKNDLKIYHNHNYHFV